MTDYTAFLPRVIPFVRECPETIAVAAVRDAAIEFCEKSHWLHYRPDPITLLEGIGQYELEPPDDHDAAAVVDLWYAGRRLTPTTHDELVRAYSGDYADQSGPPQYYTSVDPAEITFIPIPAEREISAVTGILAVKPTRDSLSCDDSLYREWLEPLAHGALWRLKDMDGVSWSSPSDALKHRAHFTGGMSAANAKRRRGLHRAIEHMRPGRPFL